MGHRRVIEYAFTLGNEAPTFEVRPDRIVMGITALEPEFRPRLARR